jgi:8-oxo-dGTP pyrophosphatase MutT (NUDIX family)
LIERLIERLRDSQPPVDLAGEALARLPRAAAEALFPAALVPAAVLVGLTLRDGDWEVLLTRRTDHLRDHPGQISFPGGRLEGADGGLLATALRETEEEVGIAREFIEVIGYLPPHAVVTGFAVSPVVALLHPGFTLRPDPTEVAEIFGVPLAYLLQTARFVESRRTVRGVELPVYACQFGQHRIWGATAHILKSLCEDL